MYHFCTYFDSNYLVRGLALYESLVAHADTFRLYVLCFDDLVYDLLKQKGYEQIVPISQEEFEKGNDDLVGCKSGRSKIEYFFTCTPSLPLYILDHYKDIDLITYLDADLFFFSSPQPIFQEFGDNSILIIGHRFSEKNKHRERYGKYNVGFLSFRNDAWGRKCLEWWRSKCIEWCYEKEEGARFADQKYLDNWPNIFEKVCVLKHKGANLAPWNLDNYSVYKKNNYLFVDENRLIVYHFHGLNNELWAFFNVGTRDYGTKINKELMINVYKVYINTIEYIGRHVKSSLGHDRFHKRNTKSLNDLVRIAEYKELICCSKYLPAFSLSQLLRPLFVVKKLTG
jgi:hypothetical protein